MPQHPRIFLYSHDTFGLGHLRRNRKIARAIVHRLPQARILLATGSEIADQFAPLDNVEIVRLPAVTKLSDGSYTPDDQNLSLSQLLDRRSEILVRSASEFKPDILLTDKEPLGLRGELQATLDHLSTRAMKILGLRDVLDATDRLRKDWEAQGILAGLPKYYDEIWIYGPEWFYAPLQGLELKQDTLASCRNIGFIGAGQHTINRTAAGSQNVNLPDDYVLVTAGGGEDGESLMNQVLSACETNIPIRPDLVLLSGPLMAESERSKLRERASRQTNVHFVEFQQDPSVLISHSAAVVSMCGYNTFCEVLEADKPVLFVPREAPRLEQLIRAERAAEFGAATVLRSGLASDAIRFARQINALVTSPPPSNATKPFKFNGLDNIGERIATIASERQLGEVRS